MTMIGTSWGAVRVIDLFVDPVLGVVMDRTRTSVGRYRPWIVLGAPLLMLAIWALFEARPGIGPIYLVGWLLVLYLGQSIVTMGHSAWATNLAPDYNGRSRAFGAIGIATVLGMLLVLLVPSLATPLGLPANEAVHAMGWLIVCLIPCLIALAISCTPEPVRAGLSPQLRWADIWALATKSDAIRLALAQLTLTLGPGWMTGLTLFYFTAARGFTTGQTSILMLFNIIAGLFGAWAISYFATRFSKHRALMTASVCFAVGLVATPLIPKGSMIIAAPVFLWNGFMIAGFDVTIRAMLADVGDEVRLERGSDQMTLIYGMNAVANKLGWALSIGLSFPLLSAIGFNPAQGAANSPSAIFGLEIAFLVGPIVFSLIGALCVAGWRLDAPRHAEIRRRLLESEAAFTPIAPPGTHLAGALKPHAGV